MLSNILKNYRRRHALLQKEVAHLIGISREYYAQIETGKLLPSFKLLQRISEKLKLNIVVVLNGGEYQLERLPNKKVEGKRTSAGLEQNADHGHSMSSASRSL